MTARSARRHSYPIPRTSRRTFLAVSAGGVLSVAAAGPLRTAAAQGYEPGEAVNSTTAVFSGGTYAVEADGVLYQYAHDDAGDAYYNSYDGEAWSGWETYEDQPAAIPYDPAPVVYGDSSYTYYTADDGYLYQQTWDTYGDATWEDVSGDYTYGAAPYASVYEETIHLYGNSSDGNVYHKSYSEEAGWGTWAAVNDPAAPCKADAKPYSVSWGDHDNAFWTGDDDYIYWNRYSYADQAWTEPKQIPSDYTFKGAPYAVGYAPDTSLYAYAVNADGVPAYNVFDGEGWAGWETYDVSWSASYQPNAYVYEDIQHVVYTGDDYHAYYTTYGADGWSEWEDLGDNYAYDTQQYAYADGLYLTYTGEDGKIYNRTYAFDGGDGTEPEPTEDPEY